MQAVNLLLSGMNDRQVAEVIGVQRRTVWEWRHDPDFQTELTARQRELWAPYVHRIRSLLPRALHTVEWQLLTSCDLKLALRLIELVGLADACKLPDGPLPELDAPVAGSEKLRFHQLQWQMISDGYAKSVGLPLNLEELERQLQPPGNNCRSGDQDDVNDDFPDGYHS